MTRPDRRRFLTGSLGLAAALSAGACQTVGAKQARRPGPIRVGVIGVRGRGRGHVGAFKNSPDSEVVAICDPDTSTWEGALKAVPSARTYTDLRELLADPDIDAVSIATPNHWHALASVWALKAGKHVYVEKPLSHTFAEGRALKRAAARYGKLVQHGTQARSHRATRDAMAWLQAGGLGEVKLARGLCYKRRGSIGKVEGEVAPPETLDYDLWTGPAELQPLRRKNLHYDWHWDFNTGDGDVGNQGVHQMDIARWGLGLDGWPSAVQSVGGRVGYDDDGNTPNTMITTFEFGDKRIVFEVRGLPTKGYRILPELESDAKESDLPFGYSTSIGTIFHGEKGTLVSSSYEKLVAYDHDGNVIETFEGGGNHFQNFLDAIKAEDESLLNANALEGHRSSALCHLANLSYMLGTERSAKSNSWKFEGDEAMEEALMRMLGHLGDNGLLLSSKLRYGPRLAFDAAAAEFRGQDARAANALLSRRQRAPFEMDSRA